MTDYSLKHIINLPSGEFQTEFKSKAEVLSFIKEMKDNIDKLESAIYIFTEMILNYNVDYNPNLLDNETFKKAFQFSDIMIKDMKEISRMSEKDREIIYNNFTDYEPEE